MLALAVALLVGATAAHAQSRGAPPTTTLQLLNQLYGLGTVPNFVQTNPTVGTTAAKVLNFDPARAEAIIVDTGTSNCTVSYSPGVSLTNGVQLQAGGGNVSEDFVYDFSLMTQEHWVVCAASGGSLYVLSVDLQ